MNPKRIAGTFRRNFEMNRPKEAKMTTHNRKIHPMSAALKAKILELIELTNEPAAKGQLLVQLQMLDLLAENTDATRQISEDVIASRRSLEDHRTEFEAHRKDFSDHALEEIKRLSIEKGARRVWAIVLGGVQVLMLAAGGALFKDYSETKSRVAGAWVEIEKNTERHKQEERFRAASPKGSP